MAKKTVRDIDVAGKKVFVRVDFNVPIDADGNVSDDKRIVAALPTIKYLLENNAKVILCSHLGRPKGKVNKEFTLAPVAKRLAELLPDTKITFAEDTIGPSARAAIDALKDGEIVLLENVRFYAEEERTTPRLPRSSLLLRMSMSPTRSEPYTVRTLPLLVSRHTFLPWRAS